MVPSQVIGINEAKRQLRLASRKLQGGAEERDWERFSTPGPERETITLREHLKGLSEEG